jgi:hypothetical protein
MVMSLKLKRLSVLLLILLTLGVVTYLYIQHLSQDEARFFMSEAGPYEQLTIIFWIVLAVLVLWRWWPVSINSIALSLVAILAAAREAGMSKYFFGVSVLKPEFYLLSDTPPLTKAFVASIVFLLLASLLKALYLFFKYLKAGFWQHSGGQFLLVGILLLAISDRLDRFSSMIHGTLTPEFASILLIVIVTIEETYEMASPLVLIAANYYAWKERTIFLEVQNGK